MKEKSFGQLRLTKTKEQMIKEYFELWSPDVRTENVLLEAASGRVLARDMFALHDLPQVRASRMDGICVRSEDFKNGIPDGAGWVRGREYMRADTGDDFDDAYDSVIAIERVTLDEQGVVFDPELEFTPGMNISPRGAMLKKGGLLVRGGIPLRAMDIAAIAMGGHREVEVYRRPQIAFIPTGSELLHYGGPVARGKNYDSNSLLARQMLIEMGAVPICYPIVDDSPERLRAALHRALDEADVVLINGGSSKGDEDFNTRLLRAEGSVFCHGVPAGPGRPLCMAVVREKPVINIPGPSLGTFFAMYWCVSRIVERFLLLPEMKNPVVIGTLAEDLRCPKHFDFIVKMNLTRCKDGYELHPVGVRSASCAEVSAADAMFVSHTGNSFYPKGSRLTVELLRNVGLIKGGE